MPIIERIEGFQRRHPKTGFPLAVAYKFFDDQGGYLAALITYYAFVSLFPLLLLMTTVLGFVLEDDPALKDWIIQATIDQIPVIGDQLSEPGSLGGGFMGVTIGLVGALYGGLGVAVASQNAMNIVWAVPRNSRPNPIRVRIRGLMLLFTVGLAIPALLVLNGFIAAVDFGSSARALTFIGTAVLAMAVFTVAFRIGTARTMSLGDVLPGAIIAGLGWQLLQEFGSIYVQRVIARASAVNSVFAVILGLIAFIYLAAALVVFCLEINVVRAKKLYPRSLLTPFTDNVVLTPGDEAAYTAAAKAQRNKGFQTIEVAFDKPEETPPRPADSPD